MTHCKTVDDVVCDVEDKIEGWQDIAYRATRKMARSYSAKTEEMDIRKERAEYVPPYSVSRPTRV